MTQKELLYVEDAIGHEQNIVKICTETINNLQDQELKTFMQEELNKHMRLCNDLINMLEDKVNE